MPRPSSSTTTAATASSTAVAVAIAAALCFCLTPASAAGSFRAGAAKVNGSLPIGVPLAGYNHGDRRVSDWPLFQNTKYTAWMTPSTGRMDDTNIRCLVIDDGESRHYFVSADAIGADGTLRKLAVLEAQALGSKATLDTVTFHASHSHSGPGAVSPSFLWAVAPATDLLVPELQLALAKSIAKAMVAAEQSMVAAKIGAGNGLLYNVTVNRRAKISPYVNASSIDPNLGILRIDDVNDKPIATLWNFAIHGTCWGPSNMELSGDIMGGVNTLLEQDGDIGTVLFVNADAGDIDPSGEACANKPNYAGAPIIADAVKKTRAAIKPSGSATFKSASQLVDFGLTQLNITLQRWENCTSGGPLDICTLCEALHCDANLHLGSSWIEDIPRFTALNLKINDVNTLFVTLPGEPLSELGFQVRGDAKALGFDNVILAGYSNNHMGYFATADEYDIGGYESELTFWGIQTASKVRQSCQSVAALVKP